MPPLAPLRRLSVLLTFLLFNVFLAPAALAAEDGSHIVDEIGQLNNQSLLWGPYRPNLYFGVRPRIPNALMTGLMWGKIETYADFQESKFNNPKEKDLQLYLPNATFCICC